MQEFTRHDLETKGVFQVEGTLWVQMEVSNLSVCDLGSVRVGCKGWKIGREA